MGKHVTKQPDGRYAIWSGVVDNFTVIAADRAEVEQYLFEYADLGKRSIERWIQNADEQTDRWREDLGWLTVLRDPPEGGPDEAKTVIREALPGHMHEAWCQWIDDIENTIHYDDNGERTGSSHKLPEWTPGDSNR